MSFEDGEGVGGGEVGEHGAVHEAGAGAADLWVWRRRLVRRGLRWRNIAGGGGVEWKREN